MVLPMIQDTTQLTEWDVHELFAISDDQWFDVEESALAINPLLTEILGYGPELIRAGATTQAAVNAMATYEDLMERLLGYVLKELSEISPPVQEALNEIAAGDTTAVYSTEEFEEHLRGLEPND